jgi:hypothetical protein
MCDVADRDLKNALGPLAYIIGGAQALLSATNFSTRVKVDGEVAEGRVAAITIANAAPPFSVLAHGHTGDCIHDGACGHGCAHTHSCICVLCVGAGSMGHGCIFCWCDGRHCCCVVRIALHPSATPTPLPSCLVICAAADGKLEAIGYVAAEGDITAPVANVVAMAQLFRCGNQRPQVVTLFVHMRKLPVVAISKPACARPCHRLRDPQNTHLTHAHSGVMFGDEPVRDDDHIFGGRYSDIVVECDPPQKVVLDGELAGTTPVHARVLPASLRVLVPRPDIEDQD